MNIFDEVLQFHIKKDMGLYNLTDEFFCVLIKGILEKEKKNILLVVDSLFEANKLYNSMINYDENVLLFPMDDFLTSEALAISPDLMITRLETIHALTTSKPCVVITNLMGYLRYLPNHETYQNHILNLQKGDVIDPKVLVEKLISIGYNRDTIVNKTGEFGVRGFVIDVFPIDEDNPIRIEFFDDEIESIRYFDSDTQKSIKEIKNIEILPYFEFIASKPVEELHFGKQKYLPLYDSVKNISDYMGDVLTFFKDYEQIDASFRHTLDEIVSYKEDKDTDFSGNYMFDLNELKVDYPIYYHSLNNMSTNELESSHYTFQLKPIPSFHEDVDRINTSIRGYIDKEKTVVLSVKKFQFRTLYKFLNMKVVETDFMHLKEKCVNLVDCGMNQGFIFNDLVVISGSELFNAVSSKKNIIQNINIHLLYMM